MSGVDVHISMSGLPQMDRHQNEIHRNPVTHQEQNASLAQREAVRRTEMPAEPDEIDKKKVDSQNSRGRRRTRKRARAGSEEAGSEPGGDDRTQIIDLRI